MSRRVLLGYLGLVVVVLAALEVPLGVQNGRTERRDLEARIEHDAAALASIAEEPLRAPSRARLDAVAAVAYRYARSTGGRVVVVDRRGIAVVDTDPSGSGVSSFASRPEIRTALLGEVATGTRRSETLGRSLLYVAVPAAGGGRVVGAARITYPTAKVDERVRRYWLVLAAIAGVVLAATALVGVRLAGFVVRPLRRLETAAGAVGEGDLSARAPEDDGPPEVRSLAAVFNETVARLSQLLQSQQEFVADASHQLRTPLTALRLRLENLERDVAPGGLGDLDGALREVERLGDLVESLLALARVDARSVPVGRVDLAALVRERVSAWVAFAEERGLRLVEETDGSPTARAAEERLRQVLDNLLENALDVSPPGGTVLVSARSSAPWVELRVRDEGPGLAPEERARAFDRFWRGRGGEGSGLGLAIVQRLVEIDEGEVELLAAAGGGLEAVVRLRPDDVGII